jgi:heme/copper-type cytochrome/quinol oxidase subunit 4
LSAVFVAAALIFTVLLGEPLDARVLLLYAGVGLFVGGMVTAISERRRGNGDTLVGDVRAQKQKQTRDQLERRRRGQSITAVVGPALFIVLAAVSIWLFFDQEISHRVQAIAFVIIFVVAAILAPLWTLTARRATDRRIAELDQTS